MVESTSVIDTLVRWNKAFMRGQMTGFMRYARQIGLSMSQMGVLFVLHGHGVSVGVSDVGEYLGVTSAAASQMLDRLVQQGLILRVEDPADRRAKKISLTEKGRQVIEDGVKDRRRWFASFVDEMTDEERISVLTGLNVLVSKIEETFADERTICESAESKEISRP